MVSLRLRGDCGARRRLSIWELIALLVDAARRVAQGLDGATAARLAAGRLAAATMFPPEACAWATGQIAVALGVLAAAGQVPTIVVPPSRVPGLPGDMARPGPAPGDVAAVMFPASLVAVVANEGDDTVTLIDLAAASARPPIRVGSKPRAIAVTPDGATACIACYGDGTVTIIRTHTATAVARIMTGDGPQAIAIAPDGAAAYVANHEDGTITPISLVTGAVGRAVKVGTWAYAIAAAPGGSTAYVASGAIGCTNAPQELVAMVTRALSANQ